VRVTPLGSAIQKQHSNKVLLKTIVNQTVLTATSFQTHLVNVLTALHHADGTIAQTGADHHQKKRVKLIASNVVAVLVAQILVVVVMAHARGTTKIISVNQQDSLAKSALMELTTIMTVQLTALTKHAH